MNIIVNKISKDAVIPSYAYNGTSAAFDITCIEDTLIKAKSSAIVPNGLKLSVPMGTGYYMTVHMRSGLGFKKDLSIHNGIIDEGYTGVLGTKIFNLSNEDVLIKKGDRYAQILVHKKTHANFEVLNDDEYQKYESLQQRGSNGFGSSGS